MSDGVPTPTLTWYKPDGSEIYRVKATDSTVQVSMKGDHDFGDYKCNAANGLTPFDERTARIKQISKLLKLFYRILVYGFQKVLYWINNLEQR